jgi:protein-disulfide isomerase
VLGAEPEIISTYVDQGLVRLVYWPMLDHGEASLNAHAAADCIGRQDVDAFWQIHDRFYRGQEELWGADRDYFINAAVATGIAQAEFESCFDSRIAHENVKQLDKIRRDEGIFNRPSFLINGQLLVGSQPFNVFEGYIEAALK